MITRLGDIHPLPISHTPRYDTPAGAEHELLHGSFSSEISGQTAGYRGWSNFVWQNIPGASSIINYQVARVPKGSSQPRSCKWRAVRNKLKLAQY